MKRKTFAEYLEENGIDAKGLEPSDLVQHMNSHNEEADKVRDEAMQAKASSEDVEALRKELSRSSEEREKQFEMLKAAFAENQTSIKKMLTFNYNPDSSIPVEKQIENSLEKNKDVLIQNLQAKSKENAKSVTVVIKAADTPLFQTDGAGTVTGNIPQAYRKPDIIDQRRREGFIRNWITVMNIPSTAGGDSDLVQWMEQANIEETTGTTAEGALKNDMHWEYVVKEERAKYITATTVVSKQMLRRVGQMSQRINTQLMRSIENELELQILFGDNTTENINGIFTQGTAFSSGSLAGTVPEANNYDVLLAAIKQGATGSSGTINAVGEPAGFTMSVIALNHAAITAMQLSKGSDGHYVMPQFATASRPELAGVPIVPNNYLGADQFLTMEGSLVELWIEEQLTIEVGLVDDQFKKNLRTIRAEMSALVAIPDNYVNGVIIGDFTTAKAELETV
jgi:hypothetical protein